MSAPCLEKTGATVVQPVWSLQKKRGTSFLHTYMYVEKVSILDINLRVFQGTLTYRCVIFLLAVLKDPAPQEYAKYLLIFNFAIILGVSETLLPCYHRTYIAFGSLKEIKHELETVHVGILYEIKVTVGKQSEQEVGSGI